jgi:hypothetical protein
MSETVQTEKAPKAKRPIDLQREKRGGVSKELQARVKEQNRIRKAIRAALASGPRTMPEIAAAAESPAPTVLWHLMAMRRYGDVVEVGERGDYPLYAVKEG